LAVEESLRLDTPVQLLARTCIRPKEIDGVRVSEGERIVIGIGSANRDERCYDDAATFRLDRPNPRAHIAFGVGPHVCPGAALARLEGTVALETIVERCASLELPPGSSFDANPVFWAHGPRTLPLLIRMATG
jgi:cytochrome P450